MKNFLFFAFVLFSGAVLSAETFNWSLLSSGSWEEKSLSGGTLNSREEIKLSFSGLTLRGEVLDKREINFSLDQILGDPEKRTTNFLGGLYHQPTGSRLLYGTLDEWGLSARIRNPWIRSPPYAENHKPLIADLKTAVSSTKNDEAYLYLSSPYLNIFPNVKMKGFLTAQTEIEEFKGTFAGGMDFVLPNKTGVSLETFYTSATLPATKNSSWFTSPPPLPERDFKLYAVGLLFHNQFISASADFALSETFAWGSDFYGNLGISLTPLLPFGKKARPLLISFAADGAGERFVYRDGANHGAGLRTAGKIEWKGTGSSLLRLNTVLRSHGIGEDFSRSSTGFYYRFPANKSRLDNFFRFTRVSFTADRNADNLQKISDRFTGNAGISLNLKNIGINSPLGVNFSGSIRYLSAAEEIPSPYPVPNSLWALNSAGIGCEFIWSPYKFQFRSKIGFTNEVKNEAENVEKWDFSISSAIRFRHGRLSLKAASSDFPEKWNITASWRMEINKKTRIFKKSD
jgi:hypothetical protein